ncbi:MAG: hypothetical protein C0501_26470 [Isosphaera sp.]|nr:hypothetical protein [Isosphaera sp.]
MTDPVALLERLYGPHWAAPLARDLAREESTVYGWKARGTVPKRVEEWLRRRGGDAGGATLPTPPRRTRLDTQGEADARRP